MTECSQEVTLPRPSHLLHAYFFYLSLSPLLFLRATSGLLISRIRPRSSSPSYSSSPFSSLYLYILICFSLGSSFASFLSQFYFIQLGEISPCKLICSPYLLQSYFFCCLIPVLFSLLPNDRVFKVLHAPFISVPYLHLSVQLSHEF